MSMRSRPSCGVDPRPVELAVVVAGDDNAGRLVGQALDKARHDERHGTVRRHGDVRLFAHDGGRRLQ